MLVNSTDHKCFYNPDIIWITSSGLGRNLPQKINTAVFCNANHAE